MRKYGKEKAVLVQEEFDLEVCLRDLRNDPTKIQEEIKHHVREIYKLRRKMRPYARTNNTLEQEVSKLDKRIHAVLKDHIQPSDIQNLEKTDNKGRNECSSTLQNREVYEKMFYILQKNPRYFAVLAQRLETRDMTEFVNTIIFDMYGDQFDSSEERLLLTLFQKIIRAHFKQAGGKDDMGSLFRANTSITMMLSTYARRGEGLHTLKTVLEDPLQDMVSNPGLTLEVNAYKVYQEVIQSFEKKTQKPWPLKRSVTSEIAWSNSYVQDLIKPRTEHLKYITKHFLKRITDNFDEVPYGIRWICKQLAELGQEYFPNANRYQIGSIVGGYLYLRYFNPAIVNPDRGNLLSGRKLSRKMRDNLVSVARVLQNQANGVHFRSKELQGLNNFLDENREEIQRYFQKLIDVDELQEKMEIDDMLENVKRRQPTLTLKYNQIYLIHRLIWEHRDMWNEKNDDLILGFISELGEAPKKVDSQQNYDVVLKLQQTETNVTPSSPPPPNSLHFLEELNVDEKNQAFESKSDLLDEKFNKTPTWEFLHALLRDLDYPKDILSKNRKSLFSFLTEMSAWAKESQPKLFDRIQDSMDFIELSMNVQHEDERERAYNEFLMEYVKHVRFIVVCEKSSRKRLRSAKEAKDTMSKHQEWLQQKKDDYETYLKKVQMNSRRKSTRARSKKKSKRSVVFKHAELVSKGVILSVAKDEKPKTLKKLCYEFNMISEPYQTDEFEVVVRHTTRISSIFVQSVKIPYLELYKMQEKKENVYKIESINLSVNLLLKMLNQEFGNG